MRPTAVPQITTPTSDDLLLKVMPPRLPPHLLARRQLLAGDGRDAPPVQVVIAPAGYGKTSLLAQWRREHLARGTVVAWVLAQARDDTQRLVQALALAVRQGSGRPTFGHTLLEGAPGAGFEGVTAWLAEVAQSALDLALFVDEADRLAKPVLEALSYLVHNAPPNLRVVVAARIGTELGVDDLVAYGQCRVHGPADLRFSSDETVALVRQRLGGDGNADAAARLHELTEGWPLGLQMALAAAQGSDLRSVVAALAAPGGAARDQLLERLLERTEAQDLDFLTRIAILDPLHPALCRAVVDDAGAPARLARLARDTPLFVAADQGEWQRLHALARDTLRARNQALPAEERATLHARAADWLAEHAWPEAAARHALAAGLHERAYALAERSLYESVMTRGHLGAVLAWLQHLPAEELARRPRLLLAAAWSLALGNRHDEAGRWVERLLAQPSVDDALRCECALILGGAAVYADDPDGFAALHDPWAQEPPLQDPLLLQIHANRGAFRRLLAGDPAGARLRQQQAPRAAGTPSLDYLGRWGDFIVGLSYVWEGQVRLAEQLLRPALAGAEAALGRRNPFACMLAALLAATLWERNRPDEAAALLAHRLDVLEQTGLPETVLLAYRTLSRMAVAAGAEDRALDLLAAMQALGTARGLPRLAVASLVEQVRLHARRQRSDSCQALLAQIDTLLADPALPQGTLWRRSVMVLRSVAAGQAALAAQDWRGAIERLGAAGTLARDIHQGRLHIELLGLRAWALDRCGEPQAPSLLREAADLATLHGLARVFDDAHPALGEWARQQAGAPAAPTAAPSALPATPRAAPSLALTPKEREVLELLARSLSNKEIGLAMQVGEETIKWHVKNLFAKLDAGTRKQVVQRARLLGLLDA
jgi:LuxR family maltose regulon positive regulatory protein